MTYQFRFTTKIRNPNTFLYNTGPITRSATRPGTGRSSTRSPGSTARRSARGARPRPARCRRSTSASAARRTTRDFTADATYRCRGGRRVFAGQRAEGFHVDLGSIFDLGALRPFQAAHLIPSAAAAGVNGTQGLNVHTIALQVPMSDLTRNGDVPTDVDGPGLGHRRLGHGQPAAGCGSATSATGTSQRARPVPSGVPAGEPAVQRGHRADGAKGPVERADRRSRTASSPSTSSKPELAGLLPVLYPGVFPNLAAYTKPRADLLAILLTGIPAGVVPGLPELHRPGAGRPAPAQPRGAADGGAERARAGRRRPGRLPERPAGDRRRGHRSSCGRSPG